VCQNFISNIHQFCFGDQILVDSGADVHLLSKGIGETALHRLYRMNIDGLFTIYDTTRYLLTTGIEQVLLWHLHTTSGVRITTHQLAKCE
jgi:hypothetical protein